MKKNFVLDTNVILHDYNCLRNFEENDIYLPIVVLEELDKFKKQTTVPGANIAELVQLYADEYANRHANKVTDEEASGAEFSFDIY